MMRATSSTPSPARLSQAAIAALAEASELTDYCIDCRDEEQSCVARGGHAFVSARAALATIAASVRGDGAAMIARERRRQIDEERFDAAHDDRHREGELALAAICYIAPTAVYLQRSTGRGVHFDDPWPFTGWDRRNRFTRPLSDAGSQFLPNVLTPLEHRIDLLVKGGAFTAAEIDRLMREAKRNRG